MIFGTPRRKDWIQNLRSFRSYLSMSRSLEMVAEVLSSTQLMASFLLGGLESHTGKVVSFGCDRMNGKKGGGTGVVDEWLTSVDFAADDQLRFADAGLDD